MSTYSFKLDTSENEFDEIFFNRPVSQIHSSSVGLISSKNVPIKTINSIYQIINTLNHRVVLVADEYQAKNILPADIILKNNKGLGYSNTEEAINSLLDTKILIAICGREINSSMELLLNNLLKEYKGIIVTDKSDIIPDSYKGKAILIVDSTSLGIKKDDGLNHVASVAYKYSLNHKSPTVLYRGNQIVVVDNKQSDKACVVNSTKSLSLDEFIAFMAGLIADSKNFSELQFLKYCQASGFLARKSLSEGISAVNKYLDDKF